MANVDVRKVLKKCLKCGGRARYRVRVQLCKFVDPADGFQHRYACHGQLLTVVRTAKPKVDLRPQDVAAKKLAHARKMVDEKSRALRRLATSLRMWEQRAQRYAKRASLTDAEIAAERTRRIDRASQAAARKVRRGIALKEIV